MRTNQLWIPIGFHLGWLHGSWLLKKLLHPDYTMTLETAGNIKAYLLNLMEQQGTTHLLLDGVRIKYLFRSVVVDDATQGAASIHVAQNQPIHMGVR